MEPLTTQHVQDVLDTFDLGIKIHIYEESTATSPEAASAIGCTVAQIAKSICFVINSEPLLVVTSGDKMVDDKKIAQFKGVGRKKVKMAKPDQCIEIFGFAPGAVPPVGHRTTNIETLLDITFQQFDMIYGAGGSANAIFPITPDQLAIVTNGEWTDVIKG